MSKRRVILLVCVIGVVGALLALTVLGGRSQPLASFTYLGTATNLTGRYGRFSVSNCCDRPIHYIPGVVEFYSNGIVYSVASPGSRNIALRPHHVETFELAFPAGARRWHGLVNVGQEKKGVASLPLRIKSFMKYGFSNGAFSPTVGFHDGRLVATPEVEEQTRGEDIQQQHQGDRCLCKP